MEIKKTYLDSQAHSWLFIVLPMQSLLQQVIRATERSSKKAPR